MSSEFKARAIALSAKVGPDAAAEQLTRAGTACTGRAIRKWIAAGASAKTAKGAGARGTNSQASASPPSRPSKRSPPPERAGALPAELEGIDPEALDFLALEELSRDVVAYRRAAKADDNIRAFAALARLEMEVRVALHKVRPPAKVDPDTDPANVEAADLLLARLEALVVAAEGGGVAAAPATPSEEPSERERAA